MSKIYENVDDLIKDLLDFKCTIHTPTENEAKEFVNIMRNKFKFGFADETEDYYWDLYRENTCYDFEEGGDNINTFDIHWYRNNKLIILEYKDIRELLLNGNVTN